MAVRDQLQSLLEMLPRDEASNRLVFPGRFD